MEFIYSEEPEDEQKLTIKIKDKVDADSTTGEMVPIIAARGIDLAANIADGVLGILWKGQRDDKTRLAIFKNAAKDLIKDDILDGLRGFVSYGRIIYGDNLDELGGYGFTIEGGTSVDFPTNVVDVKNLVKSVKDKVESFTTPPCPMADYITRKAIVLTDWLDSINEAVTLGDAADQIGKRCQATHHRYL